MRKMNWCPLMIFLLSFILGCNPTKGLQEVREKANKEGRIILENIDGYAQKAEMAARRSERACFSFMRELFQRSRSGETERGKGAQREQVERGREQNEIDFDHPFNNNGFVKGENNGG
jgi:hypothetical protein